MEIWAIAFWGEEAICCKQQRFAIAILVTLRDEGWVPHK